MAGYAADAIGPIALNIPTTTDMDKSNVEIAMADLMDASTLNASRTPRMAAIAPTTMDIIARVVIALALTDLTRSKITNAPDIAVSKIDIEIAD